jgi:hypothetical protein
MDERASIFWMFCHMAIEILRCKSISSLQNFNNGVCGIDTYDTQPFKESGIENTLNDTLNFD